MPSEAKASRWGCSHFDPTEVKVMPTGIGKRTISRARGLRSNMTQGERRLWKELRAFRRLYGLHVRRQAPIGSYVVDFVIHAQKLAIEVDGEHHFQPERQKLDMRRDAWLKGQGYTVLRFTTGELAEACEGCVERILKEAGRS